jgi:hypothetical protein
VVRAARPVAAGTGFDPVVAQSAPTVVPGAPSSTPVPQPVLVEPTVTVEEPLEEAAPVAADPPAVVEPEVVEPEVVEPEVVEPAVVEPEVVEPAAEAQVPVEPAVEPAVEPVAVEPVAVEPAVEAPVVEAPVLESPCPEATVLVDPFWDLPVPATPVAATRPEAPVAKPLSGRRRLFAKPTGRHVADGRPSLRNGSAANGGSANGHQEVPTGTVTRLNGAPADTHDEPDPRPDGPHQDSPQDDARPTADRRARRSLPPGDSDNDDRAATIETGVPRRVRARAS